MYLYQYKNHFLYNFHTGVMLVYLLTMIIFASVYSHPLFLAGQLISLICLALCLEETKSLFKTVRWMLPMMLIIIFINAMVNKSGDTILWIGPSLPLFGRMEISLEAILYGLNMSLRLLVIIWEFMLLVILIDPDRSLTIFSKVLEKSAITVSLATRSIPILSKRLKEIKDVQTVRGVNFNDGSRIKRIKNTFPLIKVLLLSILEDTFKNAEAMYARGYGVGKRSYYTREKIRYRDYILLISVIVLWIIGIFFMIKGWSDFVFYPHLQSLVWGKSAMVLYLIMMFLVYLPAILSWGCANWQFLQRKI